MDLGVSVHGSTVAREKSRVAPSRAEHRRCRQGGENRGARIARSLSDDGQRTDTPKSGHGRTVDLSQQVVTVLHRLPTVRKAEALRRGWRERPPWVFTSTSGTPLDPSNVRHAFSRILKAAQLAPHFTPHCLRHTYASILISEGVSPAYVQRQLGHASITLTVDTYGKWLPSADKNAVDHLDDPWRFNEWAAGESNFQPAD